MLKKQRMWMTAALWLGAIVAMAPFSARAGDDDSVNSRRKGHSVIHRQIHIGNSGE